MANLQNPSQEILKSAWEGDFGSGFDGGAVEKSTGGGAHDFNLCQTWHCSIKGAASSPFF